MSSDVPWPQHKAGCRRRALSPRDDCMRAGALARRRGRAITPRARPAGRMSRVAMVNGAGEADVVLGWSAAPVGHLPWNGGTVQGFVGPGRNGERA